MVSGMRDVSGIVRAPAFAASSRIRRASRERTSWGRASASPASMTSTSSSHAPQRVCAIRRKSGPDAVHDDPSDERTNEMSGCWNGTGIVDGLGPSRWKDASVRAADAPRSHEDAATSRDAEKSGAQRRQTRRAPSATKSYNAPSVPINAIHCADQPQGW